MINFERLINNIISNIKYWFQFIFIKLLYIHLFIKLYKNNKILSSKKIKEARLNMTNEFRDNIKQKKIDNNLLRLDDLYNDLKILNNKEDYLIKQDDDPPICMDCLKGFIDYKCVYIDDNIFNKILNKKYCYRCLTNYIFCGEIDKYQMEIIIDYL